MLLKPPSPDIQIYKEGFDPNKDLLGRTETGKRLSGLVERISDPMVIALDGGWGSGKSFFLQCWVGAHVLQNEGTAKTVYFDAFEHDFIDSPLASLMGVIADHLEDSKHAPSLANKAVTTLRNAALPLTRMGLAIATYGATEAGGAMLDALSKQASEEFDKAAADYWKRENGTRVAMTQFKSALVALTAPPKDSDKPRKLIIVIDELDRCRPDYALALLEIMKHFFAVPHVHFILGVNLEQLENSVKARYGAGIDAGLYLQKFVTVAMQLPELTQQGGSVVQSYFNQQANKMAFDEKTIESMLIILKVYRDVDALTLRDIDKILGAISLSAGGSTSLHEQYESFRISTLSLVLLRIRHSELYLTFKRGGGSLEALGKVFRMRNSQSTEQSEKEHQSYVFYRAWAVFLSPDKIDRDDFWRGFDPGFPLNDPKLALANQIQNHLESFQVIEASAL